MTPVDNPEDKKEEVEEKESEKNSDKKKFKTDKKTQKGIKRKTPEKPAIVPKSDEKVKEEKPVVDIVEAPQTTTENIGSKRVKFNAVVE